MTNNAFIDWTHTKSDRYVRMKGMHTSRKSRIMSHGYSRILIWHRETGAYAVVKSLLVGCAKLFYSIHLVSKKTLRKSDRLILLEVRADLHWILPILLFLQHISQESAHVDLLGTSMCAHRPAASEVYIDGRIVDSTAVTFRNVFLESC